MSDEAQIPSFLKDIRKTAFARAYSADKNLAIFLGRPPRIHSKFCHFQLPSDSLDTFQISTSHTSPTKHYQPGWDANTKFDYIAETRWSALCASLKEEILELSRTADFDRKAHVARCGPCIVFRSNILIFESEVQTRAEAYWDALPGKFRLQDKLNAYVGTPFERDFLVSTKLNYLHVLLLVSLATQEDVSNPDGSLVDTALAMLSLVVEALVLRGHLANSGTGLLWKVGLPRQAS